MTAVTDDIRDAVVDDFILGSSPQDLQDDYGLSGNAVRAILREARAEGIIRPKHNGRNYGKPGRHGTVEARNRAMIAAAKAGEGSGRIAAREGLAESTVRDVLRAARDEGLLPRHRGRRSARVPAQKAFTWLPAAVLARFDGEASVRGLTRPELVNALLIRLGGDTELIALVMEDAE